MSCFNTIKKTKKFAHFKTHFKTSERKGLTYGMYTIILGSRRIYIIQPTKRRLEVDVTVSFKVPTLSFGLLINDTYYSKDIF